MQFQVDSAQVLQASTMIQSTAQQISEDVDRMMRQMRVWLFTPPAGATAYGLGRIAEGGGARVWALLPSCRQANPDDPRDPCPVDRVIITSEDNNGASVQSMDPQGLAPGAEARRVQSFVVPSGVRRVHVKLMALNNRVRYEAIVDVERLQDLPPPQGAPSANGFNFELTQYPAR